MSTVYTVNGKVLKNSANDKWLTKKEAPGPGPISEVTIGTQTWMAKNLEINDGGSGIYVVNDVTANGYNFGNQYYYTWDAAIRVANSIPGWHIPSKDEWTTLRTYLGDNPATKLKSTYGWSYSGNGTDDYGFTLLPVARYSSTLYGQRAFYWTSTVDGTKYYYVNFDTGSSYYMYDTTPNDLIPSLRLIKDT